MNYHVKIQNLELRCKSHNMSKGNIHREEKGKKLHTRPSQARQLFDIVLCMFMGIWSHLILTHVFLMTIYYYHPCYIPIKCTRSIKKNGHIKPTYIPLTLQDPTNLNVNMLPIVWANMYHTSMFRHEHIWEKVLSHQSTSCLSNIKNWPLIILWSIRLKTSFIDYVTWTLWRLMMAWNELKHVFFNLLDECPKIHWCEKFFSWTHLQLLFVCTCLTILESIQTCKVL